MFAEERSFCSQVVTRGQKTAEPNSEVFFFCQDCLKLNAVHSFSGSNSFYLNSAVTTLTITRSDVGPNNPRTYFSSIIFENNTFSLVFISSLAQISNGFHMAAKSRQLTISILLDPEGNLTHLLNIINFFQPQ